MECPVEPLFLDCGRPIAQLMRDSLGCGTHGLRDLATHMLFMVIEKYKNGDPIPVYRRFRQQGRLMPAGVEYRGSWITEDLGRCYQVMECGDRRLLDQWIANWRDIVDFDVVPVMTSAEAQAAVSPRL